MEGNDTYQAAATKFLLYLVKLEPHHFPVKYALSLFFLIFPMNKQILEGSVNCSISQSQDQSQIELNAKLTRFSSTVSP